MSDFDIVSGHEALRRLAEEARAQTCDPGERPDCAIASERLRSLLAERGVSSEVREYRPTPEYWHYAVYIPPGEVGRSAVVVDPTFDQFDDAADTSVSLGSTSRVAIADPAASYVFA